jgi:hypothetical protein
LYTCIRLYGASSQKTVVFIFAAVRTRNLIYNCRTFKGESSHFGSARRRGVIETNNTWRGNERKVKGFGAKKEPGGNLHKQNWDLTKLRPFTKDLYQPHPAVENR